MIVPCLTNRGFIGDLSHVLAEIPMNDFLSFFIRLTSTSFPFADCYWVLEYLLCRFVLGDKP